MFWYCVCKMIAAQMMGFPLSSWPHAPWWVQVLPSGVHSMVRAGQSARQWQRERREIKYLYSLWVLGHTHWWLQSLSIQPSWAGVSGLAGSFPMERHCGTHWRFGFGFLLVTWVNSQKSVSGTELSAFSVDRQDPVVVLCCSAPHPAPSCLLSWFIHLLCPPCSHTPTHSVYTFSFHIFPITYV